jgi:hypothetical protein
MPYRNFLHAKIPAINTKTGKFNFYPHGVFALWWQHFCPFAKKAP